MHSTLHTFAHTTHHNVRSTVANAKHTLHTTQSDLFTQTANHHVCRKNWGIVREVQQRRKEGAEISLNEYCMIAHDKGDADV